MNTKLNAIALRRNSASRQLRAGLLAALALMAVASTSLAVPQIDFLIPSTTGAGINNVMSVIGTDFGAAGDFVEFPAGSLQSPLSFGAGWVNVVVPATWSGSVRVFSSASGTYSNSLPLEITFSWSQTQWDAADLALTWYMHQNGAPDCTQDQTRDALRRGYSAWTCASDVSTSYLGTTSTVGFDHTDGVNVQFWSGTGMPSSLIAVTSWRFTISTGNIIEFDIQYNSGDFDWSCTGEPDKMDVQNIGTHEEGHSISLLDLYGAADAEKTMFGVYSDGQVFARSLHLRDVQGAEYVYPRAGRPNLLETTPGGWFAPIVPRNTSDATGSYAPVPATLTGNATSYLNYAEMNDGMDCAAPFSINHGFLDGSHIWNLSWTGALSPGPPLMWTNLGTFVRGGRHTLTVIHDVNDDIIESDELDNTYSRQYVWSPLTLVDQVAVTRLAPPDDGTYSPPNCDGFEFTIGWWGAVAVMTLDPDDDYDAFLYDDYSGSTSGFSNVLKSSFNGSNGLDFVLVNGNTVGFGSTYYAGAVRFIADMASNAIVQQSNVVGPSLLPTDVYGAEEGTGVVTMGETDLLKVHEVWLDDPSLTYRFTMENLSGTADLDMAIFSATGDYYHNFDYEVVSDNFGGGTNEFFTFQPPTADYYAVVVHKRGGSDHLLANTYELRVGKALSNLAPASAISNWFAPIVPRTTPDAINGSPVALPSVLDGNTANSYMNWSVHQAGPYVMPDWNALLSLDNETLLDDMGWVPDDNSPAFYININRGPYSVRGGRHTLTTVADPTGEVAESNEDDNIFSSQYVWSPLVVAPTTPVVRLLPPSFGFMPFPNCDGMQYQPGLDYAWVVGIAPESEGDDYDLFVFDDYGGSQDGFSNQIAISWAGYSDPDFVVGHFTTTPLTVYPGVVRFSADGGGNMFVMDQNDSFNRIEGPSGYYMDVELATNRLVDVFEAELTAGEVYSFLLTRTAGTADISFAIFPSTDGGVFGRFDSLAEAFAGTPDRDSIIFTAPETGYYPIVVFRALGTEAGSSVTYDLEWNPGDVSGVREEDAITSNFSFLGGYPNPSAGPTTMQFSLPRSTDVQLDVYNLRGERVRTIVNGSMSAGTHSVRWDGRDAHGGTVASGVYWLQLKAVKRIATKRLSIVR